MALACRWKGGLANLLLISAALLWPIGSHSFSIQRQKLMDAVI